jgi:serine/threonine protein kinase
MRFQCPLCRAINQVEPADYGSSVICGRCDKPVQAPPTPLAPNALLGDFVIKRLLRKGAEGHDLLAQQVSLDRPAVLKVLEGELALNNSFVESFIGTARAIAGLNHPALLTFYALGRENEVYFLAREAAVLDSFRDRLAKDNVQPLDIVLPAFADIADGLAHAWHEARLMHMNIKPDYLYLASDGRGKLADIGVLMLDPQAHGSKASENLKGTPQYICPERILGQTVDHRGDLYSLGITLYQCVTGHLPFTGADPMEILTKHVQAPLPAPRSHKADLPEALCQILERLLAKDPAARFTDGHELATALRALATSEQPAAVAPPPPPPAKPVAEALEEVADDDLEEDEEDDEEEDEEEAPAPAPAPATASTPAPAPVGNKSLSGFTRPGFPTMKKALKAPPKKMVRVVKKPTPPPGRVQLSDDGES